MTEPPASEPLEDASGVDEMIVSPPRAATRARWAEIVFIVFLALYALLAVLAHRYAYFGWDVAVARRIQSIALPGFDALMTGVSLLGNGLIGWPLVIITCLLLIKTGLRLEGTICLVITSTGWGLNRLWKLFIGRPRPSDTLVQVAGTYQHESFPSGHVVFFVEFFGFLLFLGYVLLKPGRLRRAVIAVLGLLIALVGVSRVYLGAHWPSDVLGAYLVGGVWLMLGIEVYRRLKTRRQN